jgi:hypothetical protein
MSKAELPALSVDWESVDPAAAASLQMAIDMGMFDADDSARITGDGPWRADADDDARRSAEDALQADIGEKLRVVMAALVSDGDDSDDDEDDDADGMGSAAASTMEEMRAASTMGDEQWVVEAVTGRRRAPCGADDEDLDGDQGWLYRVAWRGRGLQTWERRPWLLDEGYGRAVAAFDRTKAPLKPTSTRAARPQMPAGRRPTSKQARLELYQLRERAKRALLQRALTEKTLTATAAALRRRVGQLGLSPVVDRMKQMAAIVQEKLPGQEQLAGGDALLQLLLQIQTRLLYCSKAVTDICVVQPETLADFTAANEAQASLTLLFHGTQPKFVSSIKKFGLLVPGEAANVKVVNGSALGVGIYTAGEAATPLGYCRGGDKLFVCAGGPPDRVSGSVRVFMSSKLVVPVFAVTFANLPEASARHLRDVQLSELGGVVPASTALIDLYGSLPEITVS